MEHGCKDEDILPFIMGDKKRVGDVISVVKVDKPGVARFEDLSLEQIAEEMKTLKKNRL